MPVSQIDKIPSDALRFHGFLETVHLLPARRRQTSAKITLRIFLRERLASAEQAHSDRVRTLMALRRRNYRKPAGPLSSHEDYSASGNISSACALRQLC